MYQLIIALFGLVVFGLLAYLFLPVRPRARAKTSDDLSSLVKKLELADFFRYVSQENLLSLKETILQSEGYLFPKELGRSFYADDEYLVDDGVLDFLGSVSSFLETQGVHLPLRSEPGRTRVTRDPQTGKRLEVRTKRWLLEQNDRDVQYRLSKDIGVPPRRINEIVHGKRSITVGTALRLARYFGTSERFWMNLQSRYDLEVEKDKLGRRLIDEVQPIARAG